MNQRLPLSSLRVFEAAARLESFSRAAEESHLTHGAVSHQVKALEDFLRVPLFARTGRRVSLTNDGRLFADRVRSALREIDDAARLVSPSRRANRLTITTMPSFAARWLTQRIGRFMEAHPELEVNVHSSPAVVDFERDEADVAIRMGNGGWANCREELFMQDEYFPVCSPRLNGGRLPKRPADLVKFRLLRSHEEPWAPWFAAAGLTVTEPRGAEFNDASLMLQAAAAGHGIALGRRCLVENDFAAGTLVRLFEVSIPAPWAYYLVWPLRLDGADKIKAFRDWLSHEKSGTHSAPASPSIARTKARRPKRSGKP